MVIALFALSLVMITGGGAAVIQGFPYVRLESGLAMVIGGTTAASAGVVLLGLAVTVMQLKRLERAFGDNRGAASKAGPDGLPADAAFRDRMLEAAAPMPAASLPGMADAVGPAGAGLNAAAATDRDELAGGSGPGVEPSVAPEPPLPDLLPPKASEPAGPDEDLFARPEDRPGHMANPTATSVADGSSSEGEAQEDLALRPALDEPAPLEAPPPAREATSAAEVAAPQSGRHAVGSYASGGNTYVMYSDGTIDADTPRGRFTFQSLDELKEFVANGEAGERGAA